MMLDVLAVRVEAECAALCGFGGRRKMIKHKAGCIGNRREAVRVEADVLHCVGLEAGERP